MSRYDDMPDAVGESFERWDEEEAKVREHIKIHEWIGAVAAGVAVFGLLLLWGMGVASADQALFNISIVLIATLFPLMEKDYAEGTNWAAWYWIVLIVFAALAFFATGYLFNPAVVNLVFGGMFALTSGRIKYAENTTEKLMWMAAWLMAVMYIVYIIPWATAVPPGPVQDTGMTIAAGMDPLAHLLGSLTDLVVECAQNAQQCRAAINAVWTDFQTFLGTIPGGDLILQIIYYISGRGEQYARVGGCIGQHGGLAGMAYDTDLTNSGSGTPQDDLRGCIAGDGSGAGTGTGGASFQYTSVAVNQDTARAEFSQEVSAARAGDFAITAAENSISIDRASPSGSTVLIQAVGLANLNQGDAVTVSITGSVQSSSGNTLSSGSCTAPYGGNPSCR